MSENSTVTITKQEYASLLKARELVDYLSYCKGIKWAEEQLEGLETEKSLNLGIFAKTDSKAKWGIRCKQNM